MDQRALELLEHGLKDMYDAEQRFASSLQKMERNADDKSLANGFKRHHDVTVKQVKRIEKAFKAMGRQASREPCKAAQGLVDEYESFVEEHAGGNGLLDAFAATAGLKVEHYEIATYRALVNLAEFCDQDDVAKLLAANLAEEEQAAAEMMTAATKLSAKLAGASATKVATRAVSSVLDHARESTFSAVGGVAAVTGRAADRIGSVTSRGRSSKKAPARKASTRPKAKTSTRKAKSTTGKAKSARRKATSSARKVTSSTRKAKTTAKRKATSSAKRKRPASAKRKTSR